jgi:uncharacterized protein (TIGR00255 family)
MTAPSPSLRSMTGFARMEGAANGARWSWELKSVNGKGLDVRFRLPPGYDDLEIPARERAARVLTRGNVQATLTLQLEASAPRVTLNEPFLDDVLAAVLRVSERLGTVTPSADAILGIRGVLEVTEGELDGTERAALVASLIEAFDGALRDLVASRAREGAVLGAVLTQRLDAIENLTAAAEASPSRSAEAIAARLAEQISTLLNAAPALDPARLHQEAALLATRADIREEIDRLAAHVSAARNYLAQGSPIGRQLDFLAQEFNREANTLCAKSNDGALTAIGLELKLAVDQLREQVQNLE